MAFFVMSIESGGWLHCKRPAPTPGSILVIVFFQVFVFEMAKNTVIRKLFEEFVTSETY